MAPYGPQIPPALVIGNMANPGLGPLVSPQIVASLIVTIRQCRTQPIQSVYFGIRCYAGPSEPGSQWRLGRSSPSRFCRIQAKILMSRGFGLLFTCQRSNNFWRLVSIECHLSI
jgi:hypothetical protein